MPGTPRPHNNAKDGGANGNTKTPKSADHKHTVIEKQKIKDLGLGNDFEVNDKQIGYFKNNEIDDHVNNKMGEFESLEKMKKELLEPINKRFNDDPSCILTSTPSYVRLMCKYANCPFQIWYTYEARKSGGNPTKIKFFRKINNNHSFACHTKAITKDKKFVIL